MSDEKELWHQAARWLARMQSGNVDALTEAEFLRWQAADARHARIIEQLYQHVGAWKDSPLREVQARHLAGALASPSRRRFVRGAFGLAGVGLACLLGSRIGSTGFAIPGDLYTGIGERQRFRLADGSLLTLNASSRVSPTDRALRVRQGEFLLDVAPSQTKPFSIETNLCEVSCSVGSLMLRQERDICCVLALENSLNIEDFSGKHYTLSSGQWLRIARDGTASRGHASGSEGAWLNGLLTVENYSLEDVLKRLRPWHHGVLRLDPQVSSLRLSGTFPLDDTRHALEMLQAVLPIKLVERTSLWISLVPA